MKSIAYLMVVLVAAVPELTAAEGTVYFADPNLKAAVEKALGISDPNAAEMLALTELNADANGIVELTGIEYATGLQELDLNGNQIGDICPLAGLTNLERLWLRCNKIGDVAPLSGLAKLTWLDLRNNCIAHITPLSGLNLALLFLGCNQISDISVLSGLKELSLMDLSGNKVSDVSALSRLTDLADLWLEHNQVSDISALSGLTKLECLSLDDNQISDISALAPMTEMFWLTLRNNQITDISALSGMTKLFGLDLGYNRIVDVRPLSGVWNPHSLYLSGNQISDVSGLPLNVFQLLLADNQISDVSGLLSFPNLLELDLRGNPLSEEALNTHIPLIAENCWNCVYYNPDPPSKYHELWIWSTGCGTVKPGPGYYTYRYYPYPHIPPRVVDIQAVAECNHRFVSWAGTAVDAGRVADPGSATTTVTVDGNYTLWANFEAEPVPSFNCGENQYQMWGYVKDWNCKALKGVEIRLIKKEPTTTRDYAEWVGYTDSEGHYVTDCIEADWSYMAGYDYVKAALDNSIVAVLDYSDGDKIVSKVHSACETSGLCRKDLIFGVGLNAQKERDGAVVFRQIHAAWQAAIEDFGYNRGKIRAYISADDKTNDECWGLPCFIAPPYKWPLCDLIGADGVVYFPLNQFQDVQVWHEYGHAIHYELYGCSDFKSCPCSDWELAEGWANYFRAIKDVGRYDHETESNRGFVFSTTPFADVLIDVADGGPEDMDNDPLDGRAIDGKTKIWITLRGSEPKNAREFYQDFTSRHGYDNELCQIYRMNYQFVPGYELPECGLGQRALSFGGQIILEPETVQSMIDSTVSEATFHVGWEGSNLDLTLKTPGGISIDAAYALANDITFVEGDTFEYYVIEDPEPGVWEMKIAAVDVPPEGETYTAAVYLTTDLILLSETDKEIYVPGEAISLKASVDYNDILLTGADIQVEITKPDYGMDVVQLYDDSLHNDSNSSDGIYGNAYLDTSQEGTYTIKFVAIGASSQPFYREISTDVYVLSLPDLTPIMLAANGGPAEGQITLTATILNDGTKDANDILVEFYDVNDVNMTEIGGSQTVDYLEPSQAKQVSIIWDAPDGIHNVFVVVDPLDDISEEDEGNNYLNRTLCAGLRPAGDVNSDCFVDLLDIDELAKNWLTSCPEPAWCQCLDIDGSTWIDFVDFALIAEHWLEDSTP